MKNFVQPGDSVTVVAASNVVSGAVVIMSQMFGVATHTALSGAEVTLKLGGVFDLAKLNAASMSMAVGANVYWDAPNAVAVANATGNTRIGVALAAVSNTATSVRVRLNASF